MGKFAIIAALLFVACKKDKPADVAKLCNMVGCNSGVELKIGTVSVADVTPKDAATASIEVCLNKRCSPMSLQKLPSASAAVFLDGAAMGSDLEMHATVDVAPADLVSVVVNVAGDATAFKDGDVYHVTVKSADGRVLSDRSWSATYQITQPNGPECEPTCTQPKKLTEL